MTGCFAPGTINGMTLENRFVRSATWEGMATPDGAVTPGLIRTYEALAEGGVGLIVTGHAYVTPNGQAAPWQLGVDRDERIAGLTELSAAVHDRGGKIVLQLAHGGAFASPGPAAGPVWAASDIDGSSSDSRRVMRTEDIRELTASFARAAARAREAGYDGVQLHCAHGYLLSQFLSPFFNRRTDAYGGGLENRARLPLEVLGAVRAAVGDGYPVLAKMNCGDFVEGGLETADAVQAGELLARAGLDALEISGGLLTGGRMGPSRMVKGADQEAYFRNEAKAFRRGLGIPVILVGGMRSIETAEALLADGTADFVSMSRPFIREPGLVNRWLSGDRRPALCISDNACFKPGIGGNGVYCLAAEQEKNRKE